MRDQYAAHQRLSNTTKVVTQAFVYTYYLNAFPDAIMYLQLCFKVFQRKRCTFSSKIWQEDGTHFLTILNIFPYSLSSKMKNLEKVHKFVVEDERLYACREHVIQKWAMTSAGRVINMSWTIVFQVSWTVFLSDVKCCYTSVGKPMFAHALNFFYTPGEKSQIPTSNNSGYLFSRRVYNYRRTISLHVSTRMTAFDRVISPPDSGKLYMNRLLFVWCY